MNRVVVLSVVVVLSGCVVQPVQHDAAVNTLTVTRVVERNLAPEGKDADRQTPRSLGNGFRNPALHAQPRQDVRP